MTFLLELLVSVLIVAGAAFLLIGSIGMVKLPDLLSRLHAPTKATTLGVVRLPSALASTRGSPPSRMAAQELVVPRSMPTIGPPRPRATPALTRRGQAFSGPSSPVQR